VACSNVHCPAASHEEGLSAVTWPAADALKILGGTPLRGSVHVGPDNHVLECALALSVLAHGPSQLHGVVACEQLTTALAAWNALGARCQLADDRVLIEGVGPDGLTAPRAALEAGYSHALLAQLAAVLCAQPFGTRINLRAARSPRPVDHIVGVLRARGAQIAAHSGSAGELSAPLSVAPLLPSERLQAIEATLPYADSAAKSALLLSGLYAAGPTTLSEPYVSFDGLERLLVALGLPLRRIGSVVVLDAQAWDGHLPPLGTVELPESATLAAQLAVLAHWLPGSDITLRSISINPSHSGVLELLRSWGAALTLRPAGDAALREPIADVRVISGKVRGGVLDADLLVRSGEALPFLAALGAVTLRGVHMCELAALAAHGEPMWKALAAALDAFSIVSELSPGELRVPRAAGDRAAEPRVVDAGGDPAFALLACTLALASAGTTVVQHAARALQAVHPGFLTAVRQLGASIESA
jgi:3-phosphoshikimate 1-carboxyvinyltransferase